MIRLKRQVLFLEKWLSEQKQIIVDWEKFEEEVR